MIEPHYRKTLHLLAIKSALLEAFAVPSLVLLALVEDSILMRAVLALTAVRTLVRASEVSRDYWRLKERHRTFMKSSHPSTGSLPDYL